MKQIKNPTAFPLKHSDDKYNPGMTLRDYFAGQAIIGVVNKGLYPTLSTSKKSAEFAYQMADLLLIERQKYESEDNR